MSEIDPLPPPEDHVQGETDAFASSLPILADALTPPPPEEGRPLPLFSQPFPLHPNFWWGILWCIGLILVTQIPGAVVAVVILFGAMLLFPDRLKMQEMGDLKALLGNPIGQISFAAGTLVAHGLIIIIALALLRILAGRDWLREVAVRRPARVHVGLIVAGTPALIVLANGAYYVIRRYLHVPTIFGGGMEELEGAFTGWAVPFAVFVIGVVPALSEELWCRAFLGRGLVGKHGLVLGVLGTSFLFGFIHVDPAQGLMAMLMGIILHYAYLTTRSLLSPMLMHFLNNAFAVSAGSILPAVAKLDQAEPGDVIFLYIGAAVLMVAFCWALYQSRARLVSEMEPAWRPAYLGVACPPPDSGTRIETPPLSFLSTALVAVGLIAFFAGLVASLQKVR